MPEMYKIIHRLCQESGTNVTAMCRALGIPRTVLSELSSGRTKTLSTEYTARIAQHFGVTVNTLLGKAPAEGELSPLYFRLGKQAQEMNLSEQDVQYLLTFMEDHQRRNQNGGS